MKRICVFAGSSPGVRPAYSEAARKLGTALTSRQLGLVYGGGDIGLMGILADTVLANGGQVVGVIPRPLVRRELAHEGLSELRVVSSMHERKAEMAALAEAFIALPGGLGTLEELLEVWTWAQLGIHRKPCGLLNVDGYYDRLLEFLDHTVGEQFVEPKYRSMMVVEDSPEKLLDRFDSYQSPIVRRWVTDSET